MRGCGDVVVVMSPVRDPNPPEPGATVTPRVQTAVMAIRYGVQADSEEECAEGLARLVDAGMIPVMLPKPVAEGRWMARAVPQGRSPVAPADR